MTTPKTMERKVENQRFSIIKRAKSISHAWRGICVFVKTTHNAWLHLFFSALAIVLGFYFHISTPEWALVAIAIGIVMIAEAFNTAIEIDIDLTSPDYHPYARDTKDVAAGAVLISVFVAIAIGLIVFLPKFLAL